ncbi:MAG: gluconate 2-dehydrogenase subunit 3 family protein [Flavobacteriaceae bacterium]|nr:gluconate 2-dehydrogenase subunit 3 family protein [Flavobacteriaceae bacterium]
MKRREAIKKIGLTTGLVFATPSIVSLLQSCVSDSENWLPQFFSEEQGTVLKNIVDVFLPKTDSPSATEVNVPEFMDTYINEVMDIKDQDRIKAAFDKLLALIKTDYNENLINVTEENYKDLLDNQMLIDQPLTPETEPMTISELLNSMKWMSINAYKISETVGETVLAYDPYPATYYCGDLNELTGGKAWSL